MKTSLEILQQETNHYFRDSPMREKLIKAMEKYANLHLINSTNELGELIEHADQFGADHNDLKEIKECYDKLIS